MVGDIPWWVMYHGGWMVGDVPWWVMHHGGEFFMNWMFDRFLLSLAAR